MEFCAVWDFALFGILRRLATQRLLSTRRAAILRERVDQA